MSALTLDSFVLGPTLGTGSYGRVRLAVRKDTGNVYALKMLKKIEIVRQKQVNHIKSERSILCRLHHPFIVDIVSMFKDDKYLYFLMEYACGGELYNQFKQKRHFTETEAKFYVSQLIMVLEHLHSRSIAYRDLKLENILLDRKGYVCLTDFGFAKEVTDRTFTFCGTFEYIAPEIITEKGYGLSVDWWALGVLTHYLLYGYAPWSDKNNRRLCAMIIEGKLSLNVTHYEISSDAKSFIKALLSPEPKRLGSGPTGAAQVKSHKWLRDTHWNDLLFKRVKAPIAIQVEEAADTRNFDRYEEEDESQTEGLPRNTVDPFGFF